MRTGSSRMLSGNGRVNPLISWLQNPTNRGLHSFTSQLNLSVYYGTGGARRECVARVKGVLVGVSGC